MSTEPYRYTDPDSSETRRAAFDEAINAVIALQIRDADRLADVGSGHGAWCEGGTSDVCHGAEADAAHERVLAVLRKLRTGYPQPAELVSVRRGTDTGPGEQS